MILATAKTPNAGLRGALLYIYVHGTGRIDCRRVPTSLHVSTYFTRSLAAASDRVPKALETLGDDC